MEEAFAMQKASPIFQQNILVYFSTKNIGIFQILTFEILKKR